MRPRPAVTSSGAGGNAIDASIATAFALAVTLPEAGNLGGGGYIVAYLADRHEVVTVDFRGSAPGTAGPRMYLDGEGRLLPRVPGGGLGRRCSRHGPRTRAGSSAVWQDRVGRTGTSRRATGTRWLRYLGRSGWFPQSATGRR